MSEDLHQLPEEPRQPPTDTSFPSQPAQPQPLSESIIPEQPAAGQPQYPPSPEFYTQMPGVDSYGAPAGQPVRGQPIFPPPVPGTPGFPQFVQGAPSLPPPGYAYGFPTPPEVQPLPLGQAVRELPQQYKKILFKPGVRSFWEEQGKADWGIIWVQILFLMIVQVAVSIPLFLSYNQALATSLTLISAGDVSIFSSPALLVMETVLEAFIAPLAIFAGVGILYLIARAFKGTGSYKRQMYNLLLFQVPLNLVSAALALILSTFSGRMLEASLSIPASSAAPLSSLGGPYLLVLMLFDLVSLALGVYTIVLSVFSIMAVHRLPGGRATAVVLIPYGALFLLAFVCIFALVVIGVMAAAASAVH